MLAVFSNTFFLFTLSVIDLLKGYWLSRTFNIAGGYRNRLRIIVSDDIGAKSPQARPLAYLRLLCFCSVDQKGLQKVDL